MKILHVLPEIRKGGAERIALDICIELSKRKDMQVQLITFKENNAYPFLTESINWKVIPSKVLPSITGKSFVEVTELQKHIDFFKPDIVHSHLFESEMVLSKVSLSTSQRVIHFHDNMAQFENLQLNTFLRKIRFANWIEKKIVLSGLIPQRTKIIAISEDSYKYARGVLPRFDKIFLLPNAIDFKRFNRNTLKEKRINELTIIGSLVAKKGHDLAIKTIKMLKDRGMDVHLNILGDGPLRHNLQDLVHELDLINEVSFHGNVEYPEEFLSTTSIYLHTASYEPFGLVLLEAMASGNVVVCTDGRGNRGLIKDGYNGFMVKHRDPELLADRLEYLVLNPSLTHDMGTNAIEFASKFDIRIYVDNLLEIYQS